MKWKSTEKRLVKSHNSWILMPFLFSNSKVLGNFAGEALGGYAIFSYEWLGTELCPHQIFPLFLCMVSWIIIPPFPWFDQVWKFPRLQEERENRKWEMVEDGGFGSDAAFAMQQLRLQGDEEESSSIATAAMEVEDSV